MTIGMRKNANALLLVIRSFVPALVPPKIPDGEKVDFDASTWFYLIIPIPLEWGLWSEQGTCVSLCSRLECTWQRERCHFLIIFSWDDPVPMLHGVRQQIRCFNVINVFLFLLA